MERLETCQAIRHSIANTTILNTETTTFLLQRVDQLEQELQALTYKLPESLLQGDPQHRNALHDGDGAVLCDWDSAAIGQPEWDLVTVEVHCRRFGHGRRHYQRFTDAYGWDITDWEGYSTLRDLRELRMITTNAQKAAHEPTKAAEVRRRIDGLRCADIEQRWNIL